MVLQTLSVGLAPSTADLNNLRLGCHCFSSRDVAITNPWFPWFCKTNALHHLSFSASELESAATIEDDIVERLMGTMRISFVILYVKPGILRWYVRGGGGLVAIVNGVGIVRA